MPVLTDPSGSTPSRLVAATVTLESVAVNDPQERRSAVTVYLDDEPLTFPATSAVVACEPADLKVDRVWER